MRNIVFLFCALAVTSVTFAQQKLDDKTGKKKRGVEVYEKAPGFIQAKCLSSLIVKDNLEELVIGELSCRIDALCETLRGLAEKEPIRFTSTNKIFADRKFLLVDGFLELGTTKLEAQLRFTEHGQEQDPEKKGATFLVAGEIFIKAGTAIKEDILINIKSK